VVAASIGFSVGLVCLVVFDVMIVLPVVAFRKMEDEDEFEDSGKTSIRILLMIEKSSSSLSSKL
jgi:hypothetical protein